MKDKVKKLVKENKWVLLTFLFSAIVVSIIYTLQKIAPFGNNSMLDVDFYHQYGPLLNELCDRIKSGESLLYSFNTGGGLPFYRNFLNYLSSPFNLILFLFDKNNIVMAFSIVIALKVIFASVTMAFYLKKTFNKDGILTAIFGILYAFSGYFCAYYWNIMWLDGMVFLPLIMLGINNIINKNNCKLYIVSLAIMLFANYFIAYMICIFSVLYFCGYFWYKKNFKIKNIIKKGLLFAGASFLAAGLVAVALIPLYYSLSSISATSDSFPKLAFNFNIFNYLFNHISAVNRTVFASDALPLPNMYPGLATLVLIILLFFNKKINRRFKIISAISLFTFYCFFNINALDFIWHAFHVPNDLPWRYSFLYVFILIVIGYYSAINIKHTNFNMVSISFLIILALILLSVKLNFPNITEKKAIICIILLISYYILYSIYDLKLKHSSKVKYAFLVIVCVECIYGIDSNWLINHDIKTFMSNKKPYTDLIKIAKIEDNDLYRIEKTDYLTLNDGAWYDFNGISIFSSMAYESVAKLQRNLGMPGNNINSYYYRNYQTPIYNTMFNIKYIMGNYIENKYYTPLASSDTYNLIGYNYSSSFVYMVNEDIKKWKLNSYMPFENQENFVSLATGKDNIFSPIKVKKVAGGKILSNNFELNSNGEFYYELDKGSKSLTMELENNENQNLYFYIGSSNATSFSVDDTYYPLTSDEYYIFDAGEKKEGTVTVKIDFVDSIDGSIFFYAYSINDAVFKDFYKELQDGFLKVSEYNDTYISGTIKAKENQVAFSTIAYDEGWKVIIDGKESKIFPVANSFVGFDVPKGNHKIELVYYPKGMKLGLLITVISLIILTIYATLSKKDKFMV